MNVRIPQIIARMMLHVSILLVVIRVTVGLVMKACIVMLVYNGLVILHYFRRCVLNLEVTFSLDLSTCYN